MIQFIIDYDKVCPNFRYILQTFKTIDLIDKNEGEVYEHEEKYDEKICVTIREILPELIQINSCGKYIKKYNSDDEDFSDNE